MVQVVPTETGSVTFYWLFPRSAMQLKCTSSFPLPPQSINAVLCMKMICAVTFPSFLLSCQVLSLSRIDIAVYFPSQQEWFPKSQAPVCLPLCLTDSNYEMTRLPFLSQRWVIKAHGLSCLCLRQVIGASQKDEPIALHYHHISWW